jgi:hypothetical protein
MADDQNFEAALQAEAAALSHRKNELNQQIAKKVHAETQSRVTREQIEDEKLKIKELEAKLLAPPEERPRAQLKTDGLDDTSAAVLRRIFVLDGGATWTPDRAQMLVDRMIAIPENQRVLAAQALLDQIASGDLDGKLDFVSVMGGSGGIFENPKRLASQTVDSLVKQIESMPPEAREAAKKAVSSALKRGAKKVQGISDKGDGPKRVSGPKHEKRDDGDGGVIDDSPNAPDSPWDD